MNLQELLGSDYHDGMTVEEVNAAISKKNLIPDNAEMVSKLKESLNKASSEASNYKKQLNDRLTAEEKEKQEQEEANQKMLQELETLREGKAIADFKANFLGLGYEDKLAAETATAMYKGDTEKVFENQRIFVESQIANAKKELVKNTKHPNGGSGGGTSMTKEDFRKLSIKEKGEFIQKNKDEYMAMYSENQEE